MARKLGTTTLSALLATLIARYAIARDHHRHDDSLWYC